MLDRAIIAVPLLEAIRAEHAIKQWVRESHPELFEQFNAAVFYRDKSEAAALAAWQAVQTFLREAAATKPGARALTVEKPTDQLSANFISLAWLDGATAQWLLRRDESEGRPVIERIFPTQFEVIIDINVEHPDGRKIAQAQIFNAIAEAQKIVRERDHPWHRHRRRRAATAGTGTADAAASNSGGVLLTKTNLSNQYVFARLEGEVIEELVKLDARRGEALAKERTAAFRKAAGPRRRGQQSALPPAAAFPAAWFRAIHKIWPDFAIRSCITKSIATVKADAAQRAFCAFGKDITWAVMDSGIRAEHPHFTRHGNIDKTSPLHADFTAVPGGAASDPFRDEFGHGTHVAGIIAGEQRAAADGSDANAVSLRAVSRVRESDDAAPDYVPLQLDAISGMAPQCKLVSLRVLDDFGQGSVSNLIAAIAHIQEINGHGRFLRIHGVNISLGYDFDPKWFACGQSPLCVEVDRLVKSGVVVVVAAGNTGYGTVESKEGSTEAGLDMTINDPGNADLAITVGATHRDAPHVYGVSFFSSKGPTGDGRMKPDLIAPGEKIISCASGQLKKKSVGNYTGGCEYIETSGTSMAAPHVSGVIAAFLSIRREFIGDPERVKQIFVSTATDLQRDRYFQGAGVVDLMRAVQSV